MKRSDRGEARREGDRLMNDFKYVYNYENFAYNGTKTNRRDYRRSVRNALGPSSDPAPNVYGALQAAKNLDWLLKDASADRYRIRIEAPNGGILTPTEALADIRQRKENRESDIVAQRSRVVFDQ
jgi:hypothetical protein